GSVLAFYFQVLRELPPGYRPLVLLGVVALSGFFFYSSRKSRTGRAATKIEASDTDFTVLSADSKVTMPWSSFSDCLESPALFVLVDRSKTMLFVVPR